MAIEMYRWSELTPEVVTPEHSTAYGGTIQGDRLEVCQLTYPAGTGAEPHTHPNEQVMVVLKGRIVVQVGDEQQTLGPGMAVRFPAGLLHEVKATPDEDAVVISVKDLVAGKGHKIS